MATSVAQIERFFERRFFAFVNDAQILEGQQRSRIPDVSEVFHFVDGSGFRIMLGNRRIQLRLFPLESFLLQRTHCPRPEEDN